MPPAETQRDTEQRRLDVCTSAYLCAAGTQKDPVDSRFGFSITKKGGQANRVVAKARCGIVLPAVDLLRRAKRPCRLLSVGDYFRRPGTSPVSANDPLAAQY